MGGGTWCWDLPLPAAPSALGTIRLGNGPSPGPAELGRSSESQSGSKLTRVLGVRVRLCKDTGAETPEQY